MSKFATARQLAKIIGIAGWAAAVVLPLVVVGTVLSVSSPGVFKAVSITSAFWGVMSGFLLVLAANAAIALSDIAAALAARGA